jgi:predicted outer membrane protein
MLKHNFLLPIAATLLFAAPAFAQEGGGPTRDRDTSGGHTHPGAKSQAGRGMEGMIFGSSPMSSEDLVTQLHQINQQEIEMARLAENRATSKAVKDYARTLGSDHQKADRRLTDLAAKKGWSLSGAMATAETRGSGSSPTSGAGSPTGSVGGMDKNDDATRHHEMLTNATGKDFDRTFLLMMQKGHDRAVLLMTSQLSTNIDGDLQRALKNELPTLEKHRKQAIDLLQRESTRSAPTG